MKRENTKETTHLLLSKCKLLNIPACEGGIMKSLRFSKFIKPWALAGNDSHDGYRDFEYQGLVSTQPRTRVTKPELWLVKKGGGSFHEIFASFRKSLLGDCPLVWKSQLQIEIFCEQNVGLLKKYYQGVYFLVSRCASDDLYVVHVEQNSNRKKFDPRFSTYSINFGGGLSERNHGVKMEFHCFIVPTSWRKIAKNK
ncbi:MAG: hypothetical protein V4665_01945 [Patescibacteria group bacterium]